MVYGRKGVCSAIWPEIYGHGLPAVTPTRPATSPAACLCALTQVGILLGYGRRTGKGTRRSAPGGRRRRAKGRRGSLKGAISSTTRERRGRGQPFGLEPSLRLSRGRRGLAGRGGLGEVACGLGLRRAPAARATSFAAIASLKGPRPVTGTLCAARAESC